MSDITKFSQIGTKKRNLSDKSKTVEEKKDKY